MRYGNNSTVTKIRAGKAVPPFSALYKAKFWQDEAWDTIRRQVARPRHIIPSTQTSQDGIVMVKVDIVGVVRTVAFVKDWKSVEDKAVMVNAVLVLCNKNTAYEIRWPAKSHASHVVKERHCRRRWLSYDTSGTPDGWCER